MEISIELKIDGEIIFKSDDTSLFIEIVQKFAKTVEEKLKPTPVFLQRDARLSEFKFSQRMKYLIRSLNMIYVSDVEYIREEDIIYLENFGKTTLRELKDFALNRGFIMGEKFRPDLWKNIHDAETYLSECKNN